MKLVLDIGNSTIAFGFFEERDELVNFFKIKKDEFEEPAIASNHIGAELALKKINKADVKAIYLSSVVPTLTDKILKIIRCFFTSPVKILTLGISKVVDSSSVSTELGCDIYANLVAARIKHPFSDLIVVDFGTATTISGVDKNGKVVGVSIASGVFTSLAAICTKAELLNSVIIDTPILHLGKTTEEALISGAFFSAIGMLEACISRSSNFFSTPPFVIATGGAGALLYPHTSLINEYDEHNTVFGILKCFE